MNLAVATLCLATSFLQGPSQGADLEQRFTRLFTGRTLRFDYHHAGDASNERIALEQLRLEGEWPGSRTQLVDATNLGKYRFEVVDASTHAVIYSRGFCSIYGEWETTGEARKVWRVFEESVRFPEPRESVQLVLHKRQDDGTFKQIFTQLVDPASRFVDRSALRGDAAVFDLHLGGAPADSVDILLVADGYTAGERAKFVGDAQRLSRVLLETEPYRSRQADLNVRAAFTACAESGVSDPRRGVWRNNPIGSSFNAFDTDRYVLTMRDRELREVAAQAPYDTLVIVFNARKYGGGGIYGLWCTTAADSSEADYLVVHEFGHSFAGLADEYYSSQVSYEDFVPPGAEPWEPNVTALLDPARLKWRDLVEASTPLPTPWGKQTYDARDLEYQKRRAEIAKSGVDADAEKLMDEVRAATAPMLRAEKHFGRTGAFEGAAYQAKGLYRSEVDCIMFTRNPKTFCRVCARSIEHVIDLYAR